MLKAYFYTQASRYLESTEVYGRYQSNMNLFDFIMISFTNFFRRSNSYIKEITIFSTHYLYNNSKFIARIHTLYNQNKLAIENQLYYYTRKGNRP